MPIGESERGLLRNPQIALLATSANPAWLWSTDASRILWSNAVGAALFRAADTIEPGARQFNATHPIAAQILRLSATLPTGGAARLERFRGFALGLGRALTCACSRIVLPGSKAAVLVAAIEPTGRALPLAERVRYLFADDERAVAVFAVDGALVYAARAARAELGAAATLSSLGIEAMVAEALATGSASGATRLGQTTMERLGEEASRVLVLFWTASQPSAMPAPSGHAEQSDEDRAPPSAAIAAVAPLAAAVASDATPAAAEPTPAPAPPLPTDEPSSTLEPPEERRHPLRFVWQMDADGRFVVGSNEFIEIVGPRTTAAFGRRWSEIAAELDLDPQDRMTRAVATRETWSGITIFWPVDETTERLPVELSGLPVFDRERNFRGYRGFGVCRDVARINQLMHARREHQIGITAPPQARADDAELERSTPSEGPSSATAAASPPVAEAPVETERAAPNVQPAAANVVPFRAAPSVPPSLSPVERKAFRELAQELTARLRGNPMPDGGIESSSSETPPAAAEATASTTTPAPPPPPSLESLLLDRIPIAALVYRHDSLIYANRRFLELSGYDNLAALAAAGGLNVLFVEAADGTITEAGAAQSLSIMTRRGDTLAVDGRLFSVPWGGTSALALVLMNGSSEERRRADTVALDAAETEIRELKSILDRDVTAREEIQVKLRDARREAQKTAIAKAEFLAKISHEVRTPLNAIAGFTEVIMAERFGPIGNERYREYLKDIHAAGTHLVSLLNDLLDLSKIETGQLDLAFGNVGLNDLTQQCVSVMQPQANRARIIIRTALAPGLPSVIADERSMRQIVLNLLANSIRFTGPGGQVIVSTAFSDSREVVLRVRDTGAGLNENDVMAALEPFRQTVTSASWGSGATGFGLALTKALAEANRANFVLKSAPNAGTLIEIAFAPSRIAAE